MRKCGECTACCTALEVRELNKEAGEPCNQLLQLGHGCSIYNIRPKSCRDFECVWLQEKLPLDARPDKTGIVFSYTQPGSKFGRQVLTAHEAWPGSFKTDPAERLLAHLSSTQLVIIATGNSRSFIGPLQDLEKVKMFLLTLHLK
jgi:hypothetical protein